MGNGNIPYKKNTPEQAEESRCKTVIRTARLSRKDLIEWIALAVNLGGIAEDVFRPMLGRMASFLFLHSPTKQRIRYSLMEVYIYVKNPHL